MRIAAGAALVAGQGGPIVFQPTKQSSPSYHPPVNEFPRTLKWLTVWLLLGKIGRAHV